jgi:prevent-host-death family protein
MAQVKPSTETLNVSVARQNFSQLLNRVFRGETRVVVEKSGIPVAAIVSAADLERLNELDAKRVEADELFRRMRAAFADLSEEEIVRDVSRVVAEVRQTMRSRPGDPPS